MSSKKLINKLLKNSRIDNTNVLSHSELVTNKEMVTTDIPAINIALSGSVKGGLSSGLGQIAGPSRHFKSLMGLIMCKAYLDKYEDAVMVFYDSEFGSPLAYFDSIGIDPDRVVHKPLVDVEQLKHDVRNLLNDIEKDDKVIIFVDSVGNLASRKEAEDALDGKTVADMTRAKQLKSMCRIVTPYLTTKDVPMIMINHTYKTLEMFSKDVVSGGTGAFYSSDWIWIIGRQQEKNSKRELEGYNFIINIEKSRHVREKSKVPIQVLFEGGLYRYSAILDIALEAGLVEQSGAWYQEVDLETGEVVGPKKRKTELNTILKKIVQHDRFEKFINKKYKLGNTKVISDELEEEEDEQS